MRAPGSTAALLSERDDGLRPFYALVRAWMSVGGSVAWMRLPAGLTTVLAVAATALVGRRVGGTLAAPWPGCWSR